MKDIVEKLIENKKTISTMESCTGGAIANAITNIEGSSEIFKFGAVTYSNEYKIKMGVSEDIINKYSVYSKETAREMAKAISSFTNSDYSLGITGKLNTPDPNNEYGDDSTVYVCIFNKENNKFFDYTLKVESLTRFQNKNNIILFIEEKLKEII